MTSIAETPLGRLDNEKRLINDHVKVSGSAAGSFLFRGELAIHFAHANTAELKADQVMMSAIAGQKDLPFYSCHLKSFASLKPMAELLGDMLGANGKYFAFCSDINYPGKYRVKMNDATFYILPLEEQTVFVEMLELLVIERDAIKKRNLAGKLEAILDSVLKFHPSYQEITYERGLELMTQAK